MIVANFHTLKKGHNEGLNNFRVCVLRSSCFVATSNEESTQQKYVNDQGWLNFNVHKMLEMVYFIFNFILFYFSRGTY